MKNKLLQLLAVSLCLGTLCVPLLGAATLGASAGEPAPDSGEPPACICDVKCAEGAAKDDCPVCAADLTVCAGKEPEPAPTCTCEVKCAEGAVKADCPVCAADLTACQGKEPEPTPVCACTVKCATGAVNGECPVCKLDLTACKGPAPTPPPEPKYTISILAPSGWYRKAADVEIRLTDVNGTGWELVQARVERNGSWLDLTDDFAAGNSADVEISENCTIYVTVTDKNGKTHNKSRYIECFDREAPTIRAAVDGKTLRAEADDALSGVEYIYINGYRVSDLTNGTADVRIKDYADSTYEQVAVYAVDHAGNKSQSVQVRNPYYKDPADKNTSSGSTSTCPTPTPTPTPTPSPTPTPTPAPTPSTGAGGTTTVKPSTGSSGGASKPGSATDSDTGEDREPSPFTPDGTGTVTDNATGEDGKEFFTITAANEEVFYLVIDRQKNSENVYFLNAVTLDDLAALAEQSEGDAPPKEPEPTPEPKPEPTPQPEDPEEPAPEPAKKSSLGTVLVLLLVVLGVGGAGYYLKIYKPKHELDDAEDLDDFTFEAEEPTVNEDDLEAAAVAEVQPGTVDDGALAAVDGLPEEEPDGDGGDPDDLRGGV